MSIAGQNAEYIFARSTMSSARLSYQHQMLHARQGYLLHPTVASSVGLDHLETGSHEPLDILDLATGNGIWLTELAYELSQSSDRLITYTGLDLVSSSFPPKHSWPARTTFSTYDIFTEVPEEYIERFDIVHVRLLVAILWQDVDRRKIALTNMKRMLKPGGWLQWQDGPAPTIATYDVNSDGTCTFHDKLHPLIAVNDSLTGFQRNSMWLNDLDRFVADDGEIDHVKAHWVPMRLDRAKYENDLSIWTIGDAKIALKNMMKGSSDQMDKALEAMRSFVEESTNGTIQTALRTVVVTGQKTK